VALLNSRPSRFGVPESLLLVLSLSHRYNLRLYVGAVKGF
jgi:hypothetical protein